MVELRKVEKSIRTSKEVCFDTIYHNVYVELRHVQGNLSGHLGPV